MIFYLSLIATMLHKKNVITDKFHKIHSFIKLWYIQVDDAIEKAFEVWTNVTNLRIVRKKEYRKEKADINIRFAVGKHDRTEFDSDSFDGLGGTVGHAFFPRDGRLHFDDDEIWTINLKPNSKGDFSHERFSVPFNG